MTDQTSHIQVGDVVARINNMTFVEYAEMYKFKFYGSHSEATLRRALDSLSTLYGQMHDIPSFDDLDLQLISPNGVYNVKVPFFCFQDEASFQTAVKSLEQPINATICDDVKKLDPSFLMRHPNINWTLTASSSFAFTIYKSLGIISISSFPLSTSKDTQMSYLNIIKNIIQNEFQNCTSIVFDVRNNDGGDAGLAVLIADLFTSPITHRYRLLNSDINKRLVSSIDPKDIPGVQASFLSTPNGQTYTTPSASGFASAKIFEQIEAAWKALSKEEKAAQIKKVNAVFSFEVSNNGKTQVWVVDLKNGEGSVSTQPTKADMTVIVADKDFVDIAAGALNPQKAFMSGKIKVKGNMALATKLDSVLKIASPKKAKL